MELKVHHSSKIFILSFFLICSSLLFGQNCKEQIAFYDKAIIEMEFNVSSSPIKVEKKTFLGWDVYYNLIFDNSEVRISYLEEDYLDWMIRKVEFIKEEVIQSYEDRGLNNMKIHQLDAYNEYVSFYNKINSITTVYFKKIIFKNGCTILITGTEKSNSIKWTEEKLDLFMKKMKVNFSYKENVQWELNKIQFFNKINVLFKLPGSFKKHKKTVITTYEDELSVEKIMLGNSKISFSINTLCNEIAIQKMEEIEDKDLKRENYLQSLIEKGYNIEAFEKGKYKYSLYKMNGFKRQSYRELTYFNNTCIWVSIEEVQKNEESFLWCENMVKLFYESLEFVN